MWIVDLNHFKSIIVTYTFQLEKYFLRLKNPKLKVRLNFDIFPCFVHNTTTYPIDFFLACFFICRMA